MTEPLHPASPTPGAPPDGAPARPSVPPTSIPTSVPPPTTPPPLLPRWAPAVGVALGVLILAATVRGTGGMDRGVADGVLHGLKPPVAVVTTLALVLLIAAYAKHRDDGYGVLRRAGTATAVLLAVAALVTPVMLVTLGHQPQAPDHEPEPVVPTSEPSRPTITFPNHTAPPEAPSHNQGHWFTTITHLVANLAVIALFVLVAYLAVRLLSRLRAGAAIPPSARFGMLADADDLADAVAAAAEALEYEGDAREAVIACYAAMEQRIGELGVGRQAADTPEDLLRRAVAGGLVPDAAATRLTDLFREARFSGHPVAERSRTEARTALAEISTHLSAFAAARAARESAGSTTAPGGRR